MMIPPISVTEHMLRRWARLSGASRVSRTSGRRSLRVTSAARVTRLSDRKSTRLNSSHVKISYAVFCLKKKKRIEGNTLNSSGETSFVLNSRLVAELYEFVEMAASHLSEAFSNDIFLCLDVGQSANCQT